MKDHGSCVNHRLELAIKDAVAQISAFQSCYAFYLTIFYLFKNSGKLKSECKEACEALDITYYLLPKIQGTRFVNHRRRGFTKLLHIWPSLITTFQNALVSDNGCRGETRAKVVGILKKLKSYRFLCQVAVYLDILDSIGPLSLVFEKNILMAYDVEPAVEKSIDILEGLKYENIDDAVDSYLKKFSIRDEDGLVTIVANYYRAGHERKKPANRECFDVELDNLKFTDEASLERGLEIRAEAVNKLVPFIRKRFKSFSNRNDIFQAMTWLDPQYWEDNTQNGKESIKVLCEKFKIPLQAAGFEETKVIHEWRSLQITVKSFYRNLEAPEIWNKLFTYKKRVSKYIKARGIGILHVIFQ